MPIYKTDKKKDGLTAYRVRINYIDGSGKKRQLTRMAYGKAEAMQLEAKLLHGVKTSSDGYTGKIRDLYEEYMAAKQSEVRPSSFEKSRGILQREIIPVLGDIKLQRLSVNVLQKWKTSLSEKDLAIKTKQNIFKELSAMLNYAVKMEYIPKNPLRNIGNFKDVYFEKPSEKLQYYTPEQFLKYIGVAREKATTPENWGYYVFFSIAFYTGMRKGEINALQWSDIEGDIIHVRRSVTQKLKGGDMETPPKNKSSYRSLQMPLPLKKIIEEYRSIQMQNSRYNEDWKVCGGIRCLRDTSIENKNKAFASEAGLPHIRIHDFRHSHASVLVNEGINIQEIARRLGHSKVEITWNTYAHLYPREEERAVNILNKIE